MIDTPHVTQTTTQLTAVIHLQIARHEIQRVMGPGIRELMSTVADQGVKPTGPWFVHQLTTPADRWDFEISVPVSAPVVAAGRVKPSQWPAMQVARTVYEGPYEGLADAWGEFMDWITTNGYTPAQDLYESYVKGPESSPDSNTWRTEFSKPLIS